VAITIPLPGSVLLFRTFHAALGMTDEL